MPWTSCRRLESNRRRKTMFYNALTTVEGLSRFRWTRDTSGVSKVGGELQFRFGSGGFDMKVLESGVRQARSVAGG